MSDLIYLIILVAIGLISAVAKAAKKKARELPRTDADKAHDDIADPWEEIIREAREYEVLQSPVEPELGYDMQPDEEREAELLNQRRIEETKARREAEFKMHAKDKIVQDEAAPEEDNTSFAERFNVIDAVIYSEILKPKFQVNERDCFLQNS